MITSIKKNKTVDKKTNKIKFVPHFVDVNGDYDAHCSGDEVALDLISNGDDNLEVEYYSSENNKNDISFAVQAFEHCCGMTELGDLEANNPSGITELLDGVVKANKGHTYILTTNGRNSCLHYEKALPKCKYWTKVKQFVNKNSKNTIQVWMSNNE